MAIDLPRAFFSPLLLPLLLLSLRTSAPVSAAEPPSIDLPALLARLAATEGKDEEEKTHRYRMKTLVEEVDRKGKVEKSSEYESIVTQRGDDRDEEVVRAVEDGKDVTAEHRRMAEERRAQSRKVVSETKSAKKEKEASVSATTPFSTDQQKKHRFTLAGRDPKEPGLVRITFAPSGKPAEDNFVGEASVDPATATVRRIAYHPADLPTLVDRLEISLELSPHPGHSPVLRTMKVEGEAGLLFLKKRFRTTTTFSDWAFGAEVDRKPGG